MIGKLVATSIVQGGCMLPTFHPAVYHYLTSGEYLGQVIDDKDVPDPQVQMLLSSIYTSTIIFVMKHCSANPWCIEYLLSKFVR